MPLVLKGKSLALLSSSCRIESIIPEVTAPRRELRGFASKSSSSIIPTMNRAGSSPIIRLIFGLIVCSENSLRRMVTDDFAIITPPLFDAVGVFRPREFPRERKPVARLQIHVRRLSHSAFYISRDLSDPLLRFPVQGTRF